MKSFLIINGPNLNLLGTREPGVYGDLSLESIKVYTQKELSKNVKIEWFQSNIEGEIVDRIQASINENWNALIINPGGYAHTSVAIHDALKIVKIPKIEVHISNTYTREEFRQTLLTAKAVDIIMNGLGKNAYLIGIRSQLI